ncbi:hypothetical protein DL89DRAFT_16693 [Linderina pennispora]|uniref:Uncharacterized protein n=1 Tax=Linderina pennispora TaxID=61395 RepID=A0A1Y1WLM7_9FUNG|nr:uncharacterized protein DL89DRAFT_16693 [Linderina pennispora]ORX74457.1 hypothetical protein DL89DRAFT_16693 [Linderina pennispora]
MSDTKSIYLLAQGNPATLLFSMYFLIPFYSIKLMFAYPATGFIVLDTISGTVVWMCMSEMSPTDGVSFAILSGLEFGTRLRRMLSVAGSEEVIPSPIKSTSATRLSETWSAVASPVVEPTTTASGSGTPSSVDPLLLENPWTSSESTLPVSTSTDCVSPLEVDTVSDAGSASSTP